MTVDAALVAKVRGRLASEATAPTPARVAALVREEVGVRGAAQVLAAVETLRSELVGAGPLEALMREPGVTDVLVNGPHEVWVDRGRGLEPAGVLFADEAEIRRLAVRLAAAAGKRLDDAVPYADIRLVGGVRLHAVLPPVSANGVCLAFRVPRRRAFELDEFVEAGAMSRAVADLLAAVVASRASFIVTGGTGTGKTTLLSTLLGCVDPRERIVLVEDSGELRPAHPHVVRLEARAPNIEGVGAIELRALVRQALRMRPDRLVVGEVRGAECVDLLAALNVGHDGGAGTVHANSVADVPARIEALCTAAGLRTANSPLGCASSFSWLAALTGSAYSRPSAWSPGGLMGWSTSDPRLSCADHNGAMARPVPNSTRCSAVEITSVGTTGERHRGESPSRGHAGQRERGYASGGFGASPRVVKAARLSASAPDRCGSGRRRRITYRGRPGRHGLRYGRSDRCRSRTSTVRPHPAGPRQLTTLLQPAITVGRRGDIADLANAVALVATNPGCAGLRRVAACWRVAAASGAALAPAIDRVADALQDEIDLGRDVTSTLAGPRATAHLLAGLPIIGLLLG